MTDTTIEWGYNCLTSGIHHGRPEAIWNIPLLYAATVIFRRQALKDLVLSRIYNDAVQMADYMSATQQETGATTKFTKEWADRIKEIAEERYDHTLQHKVDELSRYYKSPSFESDINDVIVRVEKDKLNPGYEPLHHHDTINLLCRILGTGAEQKATFERGE